MISFEVAGEVLSFEHSLISLSEWEAEFEKPFYPPAGKEDDKSEYELVKYFECMLIPKSKKHKDLIYAMTQEEYLEIVQYMNKNNTATTIKEMTNKGRSENITSELIYYWLVALKIPFQPTERWHLNRLLTLVKVCSAKESPPPKNKQSKAKLAQDFRAQNELRRKAMGTSG